MVSSVASPYLGLPVSPSLSVCLSVSPPIILLPPFSFFVCVFQPSFSPVFYLLLPTSPKPCFLRLSSAASLWSEVEKPLLSDPPLGARAHLRMSAGESAGGSRSGAALEARRLPPSDEGVSL